VPPGDPEALADACIRFFREDRAADMEEAVATAKTAFTWDRQAAAIEDLVRG
jgi:glycosyltransferase involved in cell wall biosynthesis